MSCQWYVLYDGNDRNREDIKAAIRTDKWVNENEFKKANHYFENLIQNNLFKLSSWMHIPIYMTSIYGANY